MPDAATLNNKTIGDLPLLIYWEKETQRREVAGVWETSMAFDQFSPNQVYNVTIRCYVAKLTPALLRIYLSWLRDSVGEGPFSGTVVLGDATVTLQGCYWASSPKLLDDDELLRAGRFECVLRTASKPTAAET